MGAPLLKRAEKRRRCALRSLRADFDYEPENYLLLGILSFCVCKVQPEQ